MNVSLSQSSCEMSSEIRKLELCSGAEESSSQLSELAGEVKKIEVSNEIENNKTIELNQSGDTSRTTSEQTTSTSNCEETSSSSSTSASSSEINEIVKTKRKRKRKRKKKITTTAYEPPRPFKARYKKIKIFEPAVLPKTHIRFDDTGDADEAVSVYNAKPRIIRALQRNLLINESHKKVNNISLHKRIVESSVDEKQLLHEKVFLSLKPRIIKAIVV